jgi:hypothetical protein
MRFFWELAYVLFVNNLIILKWHTLKVKYSLTLEQVLLSLRSYDSDTSDESIEDGQDATDELSGIEDL